MVSNDDDKDNPTPPPVVSNDDDKDNPTPPPVVSNDDDDDIVDDVTACQLEKMKGSSNNRDGIANATNGKIYVTENNIGDLTSIDDFHGKIVLCGVNLDSVSNTGGNLTLVDSNVKEISDHNGGIKILGDSSCENINNSKGVLEIDRRATDHKDTVNASNENPAKGKGNSKHN